MTGRSWCFRDRREESGIIRESRAFGQGLAAISGHGRELPAISCGICAGCVAEKGYHRTSVGDLAATEKIRLALRAHLALVAEQLEVATVFVQEWRYLEGERRDEVVAERRRYEERIPALFREGREQSELRTDLDEQVAALLFLSAANWAYTWLRADADTGAIADRFSACSSTACAATQRPNNSARRFALAQSGAIVRAHLSQASEMRARIMRKLLRAFCAFGLISVVLLIAPSTGVPTPVASDDTLYQACGRVFSDPHAYWPLTEQAPDRSPFAKGNAACASVEFVTYSEMIAGLSYMENLFPRFLEFYELEEDFGDGSDCATSTSSEDLCSAGLPRQGVPAERVKSDLFMIRVTDERVPDTDKKFFTFPLAIHGIERAGVEAGVRGAEDLATWAYCEAVKEGTLAANGLTNCAQEGAIPHPLLETQPGDSVTAGDALERSAIYFVFANPDGWRRGDPDNLFRFYQRYNGNGVDLNRDWPTIGFTFRPYTPWSEPETRSFGKVMKQIRETWDGGIDLHGQLIDRAFSFTLLGASERNYAKDQRIIQTVKGAWEDAEKRFEWADAYIKPNDASADDPRMYGVQWGTVWDTIDYTVTGSLGDWIDSPLGLGADGIDNEMSFSHLINCGTGTCYLPDFEQLHVDGNKSLVYSMVNFSLLPEDTRFRVPGKVAYVFNPKVLENDGSETTAPPDLPAQDPILDAALTVENDFKYEFLINGPDDGVWNGGVEGKATPVNVGGVSGESLTSLVLEQFRPPEETPQNEDAGCGAAGDSWEEVNRYYNQSSIYLQSGQAVHANNPLPGPYRICMTGGVVSKIVSSGGHVDLDISFSGEKAWEDPGQLPYSVTNMKFFTDLAENMAPGQLTAVNVDDVLSGTVDLNRFTSVVIADDPLPGYTEPIPTGPAQDGEVHEPPTKAAATAPCAGDANSPPTCVADYEFVVDDSFNNQQLIVTLDSADLIENDWDLFVQRRSPLSGKWVTVGSSTTPTGDEQVTVLTPPGGDYRARIVNWLGTQPPDRLEIAFSNEYGGPPVESSTRTNAERDAWGAKLRNFVEAGGNLVLTDGAVKDLAYMGVLPRSAIRQFSVYAGYIGFTRDAGETDTYSEPLAKDVNQPGAAEGSGHRHQTYEPVPIGYAIQNERGADFNGSPVWGVDQFVWEQNGGRTAGTTTPEQVTLGELAVGDGSIRVIGALLPMPTEQYYHPFGLANYALTYSGYQVLKNTLQARLPDLTLAPEDITFSDDRNTATITATVHNAGERAASNVKVRFDANGSQIGTVQTIDRIAAGETGTASVKWDIRGKNGQHTVTVTADPANAIAELDETNNSASRTVTVRGNQVQNGSFESSSTGSSPDNWSSSGTTTYSDGGSDGSKSVTATGTLSSWTSDPIAVEAGATYGVSVDVAGAGGTLSIEQLSATGALLATVDVLLVSTGDGVFQTVSDAVTIADGVTEVRVKLSGALLGTTTFDDVALWQK